METLDCGHVAQPDGCSTGYGRIEGDYTMCYACIAQDEREFWIPLTNCTIAYLSSDGTRIVGWPGHTLMSVDRAWDSKSARKTFVRATDTHGAKWYGSGPRDNGSYVTLHRSRIAA